MLLPATPNEIKEMLASIGLNSLEALFEDIPSEVRLNRKLSVPPAMSEQELRKKFHQLSKLNKTLDDQISFLGAGVYRHDIPAAIKPIISRGEFATAYTPYQAEASQGTLQAIYEFQTLMCELTALDVANASHYDGATALAEAALMALDITGQNEILISRGVHPHYRQVVETYLEGRISSFHEVALENGITSKKELERLFASKPAALIVQYPNFFGGIEHLEELSDLCKKHHALLVVSVNEPIALGMLKAPGELGAAIVAGEGQSLGIPVSFGGPHVGFLATKKEHMRRIPGRLVGQTLDKKGNRAFTLTLQAREQHIRREKASSNVCTNQSLCAVANAIYLSLLGKEGFAEMSLHSYHKAHYAFREWTKAGLKPVFTSSFYHEFPLEVPMNANEFISRMKKENILAGYSLKQDYPELPNSVLFTVTEMNSKEEIDTMTQALHSICNSNKVGCASAS